MLHTQYLVAEMAIDLYAIGSVVARTTRAIEKRGEEGARRGIDLTSVFAGDAQPRLVRTVALFEKNDDELRKAIASKAYVDGAYPFDVVRAEARAHLRPVPPGGFGRERHWVFRTVNHRYVLRGPVEAKSDLSTR